MAESQRDKRTGAGSAPKSSSPDDLVKDLDAKVSDEDQDNVKGGATYKLGDIKGESNP